MKNLALGLILASVASHAIADESGAFAELMLGTADQEASVDGYKSSGDDISLGIRGGFDFNRNIAIEVAYQNFGDAKEKYTDEFGDYIVETFSTTALTAGVKGSLPFENGFSLNARIGFALWDIDINVTDSSVPGAAFAEKDDGNDLYYGFGGQMKLGERAYIGAEYTVIEIDASLNDFSFDHEVKNLAIFAGYKF